MIMETTFDLDDQFWINSLTDDDKAKEVIRLSYSHSFDLSCISNGLHLEILKEEQLCTIILKVINQTPCTDILKILRPHFTQFEIQKSDIPQFSCFDDAYYKVIKLLEHSGIKGVSWSKLGFMLRIGPRSLVADTKYGENHGKTAMQLGLCQMDKEHRFWPTTIGSCFDKLSRQEQDDLKPKLCLYIPLIQNYFVQDQDDEKLKEYFSVLTESTQKRRRPNVRTLIDIIRQSIQ